jgi:hypothetical protein
LVVILVLLGEVYGELEKCYYWVVDGKLGMGGIFT